MTEKENAEVEKRQVEDRFTEVSTVKEEKFCSRPSLLITLLAFIIVLLSSFPVSLLFLLFLFLNHQLKCVKCVLVKSNMLNTNKR